LVLQLPKVVTKFADRSELLHHASLQFIDDVQYCLVRQNVSGAHGRGSNVSRVTVELIDEARASLNVRLEIAEVCLGC
jgi:hypothetical protein